MPVALFIHKLSTTVTQQHYIASAPSFMPGTISADELGLHFSHVIFAEITGIYRHLFFKYGSTHPVCAALLAHGHLLSARQEKLQEATH
jgi:hypothetical protein